MIRRSLRRGVRLGLLAGIGFALFKLVQGRRSSDFGSPSPDWAPAPVPNPNLPKHPPDPELVTPVILEEIVQKKAATRAEPAAKKAAPVDKAAPVKKAPAAKKVAPAAPKKAAPAKKAPPKKQG